VSAHDLDKTFVGAPKNFVGVMDATANLRSDSGRLLHSHVVRLEWIEKKQEDFMPALGREPAAAIPPLDPEQTAALVKVGRDLLKQGDIATARSMLKRAAIAGNAEAALELGITFEKVFLDRWGVLGFAPDVAQAREWYDRAITLGSIEASRRREQLASMPK
jgi:hypothetical protein